MSEVKVKVATGTWHLPDDAVDVLNRLSEGQKLGLADRRQDRVRQNLRRAGMIERCAAAAWACNLFDGDQLRHSDPRDTIAEDILRLLPNAEKRHG